MVAAPAIYLTIAPVGAGYLDTEHLDACQAACPLPIHSRWVCGDWVDVQGGTVVLESGLSILVAVGPFCDDGEVVAAAVRFLEQHHEALRSLAAHPSVDELRLILPPTVCIGVGLVRVPRRVALLANSAGVVVTIQPRPADPKRCTRPRHFVGTCTPQ